MQNGRRRLGHVSRVPTSLPGGRAQAPQTLLQDQQAESLVQSPTSQKLARIDGQPEDQTATLNVKEGSLDQTRCGPGLMPTPMRRPIEGLSQRCLEFQTLGQLEPLAAI